MQFLSLRRARVTGFDALSAWVQAIRPLAHGSLAFPLLLGEAIAMRASGSVRWPWIIAAHAFALAFHLFVVFINDLADEAADRANLLPTAVSGGSRVLVEARVSRRALVTAAWLSLGCLGLLALLGGAAGRPLFVPFAAAAVGLLLAYSWPAAPNASFRGLSYVESGAWLQAIGMGALLPMLGFYLQGGIWHRFPTSFLLPALALSLASHLATAAPDAEADRGANKRTFAVRYGAKTAQRIAALLTGVAICLIVAEHSATGWHRLIPLVGAVPFVFTVAPLLRRRPQTASTRRNSALTASLLILASVQLTFGAWIIRTMQPVW